MERGPADAGDPAGQAAGRVEFSGTVVVLLDEQVPPGTDDTLLVHARRAGLDQLVELLLALGNPPSERQVTSVRVQELIEAERARLASPFPPLRSLTRYWRVDVVDAGVRVEEAVARLRDVRGVALAYGELVVTDPALIRRVVPDRLLPGDDPLYLDQRYLQPAPDGVDAAAAWGFLGGRGEGVQFIDVEEAWRWTHEDLDALGVTLLRNTNRDGRNGFPGDHGNATLGVVAGVDRTVGVVGIAPRLDKVLAASHFKQKGYYVVDALAAVGTVVRCGDVVLLEVQRAGLPTETQLADFDAIRFVAGVASPDPGIGAVVVEAASNGDDTDGVDLDVPQGAPAANTQWWAGRTADSGAILVGAGRSQAVDGGHECRRRVQLRRRRALPRVGRRRGHRRGGGLHEGLRRDERGVGDRRRGGCILQGMHKAAHGVPLGATALRALLADPAAGHAAAHSAGPSGRVDAGPAQARGGDRGRPRGPLTERAQGCRGSSSSTVVPVMPDRIAHRPRARRPGCGSTSAPHRFPVRGRRHRSRRRRRSPAPPGAGRPAGRSPPHCGRARASRRSSAPRRPPGR